MSNARATPVTWTEGFHRTTTPIYKNWRDINAATSEPKVLTRPWQDIKEKIYVDHIVWRDIPASEGKVFTAADELELRETADASDEGSSRGKYLLYHKLRSVLLSNYSFDVKRWVEGVHVKKLDCGKVEIHTTPA